jgi:hypothetical protein
MMFIELMNAETLKLELFNVAYLDKITDLGHGFIQIGKSTYDMPYNKLKHLLHKHHAKNTLEKINES